VFDPLGGLDDLRAGHVRFVGEAAARIREDYLRILRFFRFTAHYADPTQGIDAEGLAACADLAEGIDGLSRERLGHEMRKLLAAGDPGPAVAAMAASGVLGRVLPGADARALPVLVHLEGGAPPDWRCRLAVLGGADAAERLKLSRSEARDLGLLREAMGGTDSPAALGFRLKELGVSAVPARAAVLEQPLAPDWRSEVERGAAATFPVRAADLPTLSGPALGARLKALMADWLAGGLTADKQTLLQGKPGPLV
jgi:poly(A) polymerase